MPKRRETTLADVLDFLQGAHVDVQKAVLGLLKTRVAAAAPPKRKMPSGSRLSLSDAARESLDAAARKPAKPAAKPPQTAKRSAAPDVPLPSLSGFPPTS